jgi:hypothetical protein
LRYIQEMVVVRAGNDNLQVVARAYVAQPKLDTKHATADDFRISYPRDIPHYPRSRLGPLGAQGRVDSNGGDDPLKPTVQRWRLTARGRLPVRQDRY